MDCSSFAFRGRPLMIWGAEEIEKKKITEALFKENFIRKYEFCNPHLITDFEMGVDPILIIFVLTPLSMI